MINSIINFLKSLFIKDKEEPTMEALHNISIQKDTKFRVVDDAGVDIESGKYVGDDIAKALGHMDKDGEFITKGLTEKYEKEKEKAKKLIDKSVEDHERNKLSEEIVGDKGAKYIYESPDGGDTVYRRKFGEDKKELVDKKEWEKKKKPI